MSVLKIGNQIFDVLRTRKHSDQSYSRTVYRYLRNVFPSLCNGKEGMNCVWKRWSGGKTHEVCCTYKRNKIQCALCETKRVTELPSLVLEYPTTYQRQQRWSESTQFSSLLSQICRRQSIKKSSLQDNVRKHLPVRSLLVVNIWWLSDNIFLAASISIWWSGHATLRAVRIWSYQGNAC
jgi:hypothetical protein